MQNSRPNRPLRTVVVGAGTAGCALAARLSEDPARAVTLLEAGPARLPEELRDPRSIQGAAPQHPANWAFPAHLDARTPYVIARGRVLGGSSAVNGGVFVRPRPSEFDEWATVGGAQWRYERMLPLLRAIESDLDLGESTVHGGSGPLTISRSRLDSSLERAFVDAARRLGYPFERDKNDPAAAIGVGALPSRFQGSRVTVAEAYRIPEAAAAGRLELRTDEQALHVEFDGNNAVGVGTTRGSVPADEVVLCAGAIGSAHLLLASGIGPAEHLAAVGVPVIADLAVGAAFSDHPAVTVPWPVPALPLTDALSPFPAALDWCSAAAGTAASAVGGDLQIILVTRTLEELLHGADVSGRPRTLSLLVSLQEPRSRGTVRLASADPAAPPVIDFGYLAHTVDRVRLREGVRVAAALLRTDEFAPFVVAGARQVLPESDDDGLLDAWIDANLGTAMHACGTAPMGAVVDGAGRVRDTQGLRVADTSILPRVPTRGPFAAAVLVGEAVARAMRTGE